MQADAYVVNTCSVTAVSDQKSRQVIHGVQRKHPGAVVAVCGCYPQTHAGRRAEAGGGPDRRHRRTGRVLSALLEEAAAEKRPIEAIDQPFERRVFEVLPAGGLAGRTRAMLKVEDGCVNFCTYCIIPYARGRVRSLPVPTAVEQTRGPGGRGLPGDRGDGHRDLLLGPGPEERRDPHRPAGGCLPPPHRRSGIRLGSLEPRTITEDFCRRAAALPEPLPPVPPVHAVADATTP